MLVPTGELPKSNLYRFPYIARKPCVSFIKRYLRDDRHHGDDESLMGEKRKKHVGRKDPAENRKTSPDS